MNRREKIAEAKAQLSRSTSPSSATRLSSKTRCTHLGLPTGKVQDCTSCKGSVRLKLFTCDVHTSCTLDQCRSCVDHVASVPKWSGSVPLRLDHHNLAPGVPGLRFNMALHEWGHGHVLCWRSGWKGSDLWICQTNSNFSPISPAVKIDIRHPAAGYGREDPTLFVYRGQLHVAFVGVQGRDNRVVRTNMMYARLGHDFRVEAVFAPSAPGEPAQRWQKNWSFFTDKDDLYCVYSIRPHRVLKIVRDRAEWVAHEPLPFTWHGGEPRGGATPVRVGDEMWSFFHDRIEPRGRKHQYRVGLYTFEAARPFRPVRMIPTPILAADPLTNPDNYCDVIFPRGAVHLGDRWVLSSGCHDRFAELRVLSHELLLESLRALARPDSTAAY